MKDLNVKKVVGMHWGTAILKFGTNLGTEKLV